MLVTDNRAGLRAYLAPLQERGQTVGFVPTMGALHDGHVSLVRQALEENDVACCSIFVNPTQFNNASDLEHYPRTLEHDLKLLEEAGCQCVFTPQVVEMYPPGEDISRYEIDLGVLDSVMEGTFRPGHFRGVALVVGKFLDMVLPDRAYFGQKDFQQLQVVQLLQRTLKMPVEIIGCPTHRENDGLAMSSRNLRLTPEQRQAAPIIYQMLQWARTALPDHTVAEVEKQAIERINALPELEVEYFTIADVETLLPAPQTPENRPLVACTSVFAGPVRLIDNQIVFP